MKRLLLSFTLVLTTLIAIGVGIGKLATIDSGYVVFSFLDYTLEMNFIFFLILTVVLFLGIHYSMYLIGFIFKTPRIIQKRYTSHQDNKSLNGLLNGLLEMSEGHFAHAEKILTRRVSDSKTQLLHYLAAARAAQQANAYDRRDKYLRLAYDCSDDSDIAIGLTQAELQLQNNQAEQALATLSKLRKTTPKHDYVAILLAKTYRKLNDWDNLCGLLAELRRNEWLPEDELHRLETEAHMGNLQHAGKKSLETLEAAWGRIPQHVKAQSNIVEQYAAGLIRLNASDIAEPILREFLNHDWQESLVALYAHLDTSNSDAPLQTAENWLAHHSRSALLLLTLGKICVKQQLWGKARNYFEASINIQPMAESYSQLAQLLEEKLNEAEAAQSLYKKGLLLTLEEQH